MPKAVEDCVSERLANPDFQAPKTFEGDRESFAYALCNALYKKGELKGALDIGGLFSYVTIDGQTYFSTDGTQWLTAAVTLEEPTDADLEQMNRVTASLTPGSIIKFSDATLVRAEVNKNLDEIDSAGVRQIAESLALKPIDIDHDQQRIAGFFIKGEEIDDAVVCSGCIYAGRWPEVAFALVAGKGKLSVDARAMKAICRDCGGTFRGESEYCGHINRKSGGRAIRKLEGLEADGGSVVKYPAGSDTEIPAQSLRMIAQELSVESPASLAPRMSFERVRDLITATLQKGRDKDESWPWVRHTFPAPLTGYTIVEHQGKWYQVPYSISDDEEVTLGEWEQVEQAYVKAMMGGRDMTDEIIDLYSEEDEILYFHAKQLTYKQRQGLKDSDFALIQKADGERRRRFPIHDCAHARNALARLPRAKNLSANERATVKRKAQAKLNSAECKRQRAKGGVEMTEEELQQELQETQQEVERLTSELETAETAAAKTQEQLTAETETREKAEAERDEAITARDEAVAKAEELQNQVDEMHLTARLEKVTAYLDAEQLKEQKEAIAGMPEGSFSMFVASLEEANKNRQNVGHVLLGDEGDDGVTLVWSEEEA